MTHRLLFASVHSYIDPSSGAALATRELLELLAARSWDCRALTCGVLDYQDNTPLDDVLAAIERPASRAGAALSLGGEAEVFDFELDGVRVTLLPTAFSRAERAPNPREAAIFIDLAEQALDRFKPEILLTYGGHPACLELMRRARAKGVAVVFHLHNFGYGDRRGFVDVSAVIFPSEYSRRHYRRTVGLDGPVIADPIRIGRCQLSVVSGQLLNAVDCAAVAGRRTGEEMPGAGRHSVSQLTADNGPLTPGASRGYVTFINPQPEKGAAVFARIALELGRRRPDIPFLIVEGRGKADGLAGLPVDLSGLTNLNRMANTPDPRDFYRVSRVILMPSLWRESLGRVPIEAMANGIPVLASDRGALPETLGDAGFVFTIPERCTPANGVVPTAQEVAPWLAGIERLWDDPEFEVQHRERALAEAKRWDRTSLADQYEEFFLSLDSG
jgi:glycosyltransferase involved in cell wall biosynthesis